MPTVIDALVVSLGLDPSEFVEKSQVARADLEKTAASGRKVASDTEANFERATEASVKHSKEMEAWGKNAAQALGLLRDTAVGLFAALGGAAAIKMTIDTAEAEASTARLAHNLQLPVKTLSEWQLAMRTVGGNADDANSSLQAVQNLQMHSMWGDTQAANTLGLLHVSQKDDPSAALVKMSEFFATHDTKIDQAIAARAGISTAMLNFLEQGPAAVKARLLQEAPYAQTQAESDSATKLQTQWGQLEDTFSGITNEVVTYLTPALSAFLSMLQSVGDWLLAHPKLLQMGTGALVAGTVVSGVGAGVVLRKAASWLLGRGGAAAASQAAELEAGAETVAGGGAFVITPLIAAALVGFEAGNIIQTAPHHNPDLSPTAVPDDVEAAARADAVKHGVDPDYAAALIRIEGGGKQELSPMGAFGPAQLLPGTAHDLGVATSLDDPNYTWQANLDGGIRYMAEMLKRYHGDKVRAAVAYNWGPGHADAWNGDPSTLPAETQRYLANLNLLMVKSGKAAPVPNLPAAAKPSPAQLPSSVVELLNHLRPEKKTVDPHAGMYQSSLDGKWHSLASAAIAARANSTTNHNHSANHDHSTHHTSHEVSINGPITVTTKAKDADGISRSLGDAIKKNAFLLANSNTGLA